MEMGRNILMIAEEGNSGKRLSEVIPGEAKFRQGYIEKGNYTIAWAYGHLLDSLMPDEYEEFTGWNWESIPFKPPNSKLDYKPSDKTKFDKKVKQRQLKTIKDLFESGDFDVVYNACDAEREGELIFWEIYHYCQMDLPVERVWFTSQETSDLVNALENRKCKDFYQSRKEGSYARQYADWLLGLNLTIGFSVKTRSLVHIGRVQTPTLSLLVSRRKEIENFKPQTYFELDAEFGERYTGKWFKDQKKNTRFDTLDEMKKIAEKIKGKSGKITEKNVRKQKRNPKGLFDLSELQKEGNRKFKYTASKTLEITQALYDKYRVVSYPRTDSRHIMESQVPGLKDVLESIVDEDYIDFAEEVIEMGIPTNKSFVDDKKVSDHYAIIPTRVGIDKNDFRDERNVTKQDLINIYDLIMRRFLAVFYPAAEFERTEIITDVDGETFKTNGRILIKEGWRKVYGSDEDENKEEKGMLPPVEEGEENPVTDTKQEKKQTRPPSYHNDASLVSAMENARNLLDDEDQEKLKDSGSSMELGTVATRGNIIDGLERREYIKRKGSRIIATDKGVKLISIAPNDLKSPEITAEWERKLRAIEEEQYEFDDFKEEIWEYVKEQVQEVKDSEINVTFEDNRRRGNKRFEIDCPRCGGAITEWKSNYRCDSHTREDPCFNIMKTILKKRISKNAIKKLLETSTTPLIKGFVSKKGGKFNARLVWKENNRIGFEFEDRMKESGEDITCKKCGKEVQFFGNFYTCGTKDENDKFCFSLPAKYAGKKFTPKIVKQLMEKGETEVYELTSKRTKKKYRAKFTYDLETNKIEMKFENN